MQRGHVLGHEGPVVDGRFPREAQEFLLPVLHHAVLGGRAEAPAGVHLVEIGLRIAHAGHGKPAEARPLAVAQHHLVRGAQHFLPQGAEKVEMIGTGAQRRLLHHAVDIAEGKVVLRGDLEAAGDVERRELIDMWEAESRDEAQVRRAIALFESTGAIARSKERIAGLWLESKAAIETPELSQDRKDMLTEACARFVPIVREQG